MSGGNDMLDCRAVIFAMNNILQTGLVSAPTTGNITIDRNELNTYSTNKITYPCDDLQSNQSTSCQYQHSAIPEEAKKILEQVEKMQGNERLSIKTASLAMIGGYLIKVIQKKVTCVTCLQNVQQEKCNSLLLKLIDNQNQDHGGLNYPNSRFIAVLSLVLDFVKLVVHILPKHNITINICQYLKPHLKLCPVFQCENEPRHHLILCEVICDKFVPMLLKNIAKRITEDQEKKKFLHSKILNRKILKIQ